MRTSFLLEDKYGVMIEKLSREEAGDLLKAIYWYRTTGEVAELPSGADVIFALIKGDIDERERKRRHKRDRASRIRNDAELCERMRNDANACGEHAEV